MVLSRALSTGRSAAAAGLLQQILAPRERECERGEDAECAGRRQQFFGQLWDYQLEAWARRFVENWRASLEWQRLEVLTTMLPPR